MPTLRILGGSARGRAIAVPDSARPTGARLRKSLFDLLAVRYPDGRFLDLYAGSGAVGLEAASREYDVTLVEKNSAAVRTLERNAQTLGLRPRLLPGDAMQHLPRVGAHDVVFLDPPYAQDIPNLTRQVLASGVVAQEGVLIVQHPVQVPAPAVDGWAAERRKYGSNVVTLYTRLTDE